MTRLKWYNVTSDNSAHIVPLQEYLFSEFLGFYPRYINLGKNDVTKWGKEVAHKLPEDEYIVFGLDDYLPHHPIKWQQFYYAQDRLFEHDLERFELGRDASRHPHLKPFDKWFMYTDPTPYSVSCQFSIWKTEALKRELRKASTPWVFEVEGKAKAGCLKDAAMIYNESSAVSGRKKGKVNLAGMPQYLVEEVIGLGLVDPSKVVYSWKP